MLNNLKKNNLKILSSAFFFFIVSIAFVLTMLRFGVPLIISFTSLLNRKDQPTNDLSFNFVPPPDLFSLKDVTNTATIELQGKSFSMGIVKVFVNQKEADKIEVKANDLFSSTVALDNGENFIYALIINSEGKVSEPSKTISIIYDNSLPLLEISSPANQTRYSGNSQKTIFIEGQTDKDNLLFISERQAVVDKNGRFKFSLNLSEGENIIKVAAENSAGNKTEKEITLYFSP